MPHCSRPFSVPAPGAAPDRGISWSAARHAVPAPSSQAERAVRKKVPGSRDQRGAGRKQKKHTMQAEDYHAHADTSRILLLAARDLFDLGQWSLYSMRIRMRAVLLPSSGFGFWKSPFECLHRWPPRLIYRHLT